MEEIEVILQEASLDEKLKLLAGIPLVTGIPAHRFSVEIRGLEHLIGLNAMGLST